MNKPKIIKNNSNHSKELGDCAICGGFTQEITVAKYTVPKTPTKPAVTVQNIKVLQCQSCGEQYHGHLQLMELNQKIVEAHREVMNLLSAYEIKDIRSGIKIPKERLEKILGFNPKSFHRWESGISIQSQSADTILRMLRKAPDMVYALADERQIPVSVAKGRPRKVS